MLSGSRLAALVVAGGTALPLAGAAHAAGAPPQCSAAGSSPLVRGLRRAGARDAALETGAAGDLVVREMLRAACSREHAVWLAATCAPFESGGLVELRRRLALDLARLPATLLVLQGDRLPRERRRELFVVATLVDTALAAPSVEGLAWRLARAPEETLAFLERPCPDRGRLTQSDPLAAAGALVEALLALRPAAGQPEAEAALARALADASITTNAGALDSERQQLVEPLLAALRDARRARARTPAEAAALVETYARLVTRALSLVEGRPTRTDTTLAVAIVRAVAGAALRDAAVAALELVRSASPHALPPELARTADVLGAVAEAADEDAARAELLRLLAPLGPWAEHVLFDANLGAVRLEERDFTFSGDGLLGYQGDSFGIAARGAVYEYDFTSSQRIVQTSQAGGGLDGWWVSAGEAWRFELRGEGAVAYLDTTRIGLAPGDTLLADETSLLGRGLLLGALRWQPSEHSALGLWLGGGAQYEDYTPLSVPRTGAITLADETSVTLALEARLRAQVALVPRWLGLRVRGDVLRYRVQRDRELFVVGSGAVSASATSEATTQLEAHGRVFLDAEVARLAGFVPGVYAGADHYSVEGPSAGTASTTTPVFGAGIRRVAF